MVVRNGGGRPETLFGTPGRDELFGGGGNDLLYGGRTTNWYDPDRDDTLDGGTGSDRIYGGFGNDLIRWSVGEETVYGGGDTDTLDLSRAREGADLSLGGFASLNRGATDLWLVEDVEIVIGTRFGDDLLAYSYHATSFYGGAGGDTLTGGYMVDRLVGGGGSDRLLGDGGSDRLYGGAGGDHMFGDEGDDRLYGGGGGDTFYGGDGNDTLYGGSGRDLFFVRAGDVLQGGGGGDSFDFGDFWNGAATITDFAPNRGDQIALPGNNTYNTLDDILADATERNGTTTLHLFDNFTIILEGVTRAELTEDSFYF